jgi:Na+-translocating ferredoxin:NAD+ oxidoreductase subunit A
LPSQFFAGRYRAMTDLLLLFIATALVNNVVLVKFLGLCPFMGVSNQQDTALGMAAATSFVLTLTSGLSYLVNSWLLIPLGLEYLRTLSFILVIAVVVQFTEMAMAKTNPLLHRLLGIYLPLVTSNCAVLGIALLNVQASHSFIESLVFGFAAAAGFSLVLMLFTGIRERINVADVPIPFRGAAIGLITAGLMSLAFLGFAGLIK